jgi:hypothetical protein
MKTMNKTLMLLLFLMSTGKCLATTYTLIASGNWDNTAIWSPSGVPSSEDDVVFSDIGTPLKLTLNGNVSIRSLNYDGDYRRDTLSGSGIITLSENSSWVGGWIGGSVELVVPSGKSFNFDADTDSSNRRALQQTAKITNNGSITWTGNGVYFYDSALIDNNGTFTDNTSTNRLYREDGASTLHFINDGTFSCNSQEVTFNIYFTNNGTINLNNGYLLSNIKLTNNGTINLNSDAATNNKIYNYDSATGTLHFGVNTTVEIISYNIGSTLGTVTGSAGTIIFGIFSGNMTATVINAAISSGIALDFSAQGRITLNTTLTLNNSTSYAKDMDGNGKLALASGKTMTWTRGSFSGSVEVIVASGATLTIAGDIGQNALEMSSSALITNNGNLEFNTGSLVLSTSQKMIENNGSFNLNGDWTIFNNNAGAAIILNNGTLRKKSGSGTATLQCQLSNASSGSTSVEAGTLSFSKAVVNAGTLKGNGTMSFNAAGQSLGGIIAPGLSIGSLTLSGALTITGNIYVEVNGASRDLLTFSNNLVLSNASLTVVETGSPLTSGSATAIISNSGTRTGTFTSTTFPSASYSLSYGSSDISLLNSALPVELIGFIGKVQESGNLLRWTTAREENTAWHIVERSRDGKVWEELGRLKAAGHSLNSMDYELEDVLPFQVSYYQLRSVDLDGRFSLSKVVALERRQDKASKWLHCYPNPATSELAVDFSLPGKQGGELLLMDAAQRPLRRQAISAAAGRQSQIFRLEGLPAGRYFVCLSAASLSAVQMIVKQ